MGAAFHRGSSKQDIGTPPDLLAAVKHRLRISEFSIDLAASKENTVAARFITEEEDSLSEGVSWQSDGWAWLNPPFANIAPWVKKATHESFDGASIVMLVPASVGSRWWSAYVEYDAFVSFLAPRVTFVGSTTPYPKDCALLFFTPWGFRGTECWTWK